MGGQVWGPIGVLPAGFGPVTTVYSAALDTFTNAFAGITYRDFCQTTATGQSQIRVTFQAGNAGLQTDHCSIGVGNGTDADVNASPFPELTFDSGASGFNIGANATKVSDWKPFTYAGTPILIVVIDVHASGNVSIATLNTGSTATGSMFNNPGASYALASPTSGFSTSTTTWGTLLIETR